ncbi:hypothetical protein QWM81_23825 [Streptomyces ficellus]|uniref:Uncharacterized protein n=1 Tax=Streptomyces ficellus TaxID=1977088 RepID=A0ABT7ZBZ3_9ACTN|nr:hypothetical protein [Streptomyces ficellus]MDN3297018.1 hypothetical protein [Streptomyces ficellus]
MGEFTFTQVPAALTHSNTDSLLHGGVRIELTWSASVLEEFIEAMARIEEDFVRSWNRTREKARDQAARADDRIGLIARA